MPAYISMCKYLGKTLQRLQAHYTIYRTDPLLLGNYFDGEVRKDFEMSAREPRFTPDDVARVTQRTLVMAADDDITPLDHQLVFYRGLPNGELAIVPAHRSASPARATAATPRAT